MPDTVAISAIVIDILLRRDPQQRFAEVLALQPTRRLGNRAC
jgi:hypothetical protein